MNNDLLFDFTLDKKRQRVFITREFDADLSLVGCFTKAEILDQWVAPKPLCQNKFQDFKVGGRRFYALVFRKGERWPFSNHVHQPQNQF